MTPDQQARVEAIRKTSAGYNTKAIDCRFLLGVIDELQRENDRLTKSTLDTILDHANMEPTDERLRNLVRRAVVIAKALNEQNLQFRTEGIQFLFSEACKDIYTESGEFVGTPPIGGNTEPNP